MVAIRALDCGDGVRRRNDKLRKSRTCFGTALAGDDAAGSRSADGNGLESGRPDLLLHTAEHESPVRRDESEVARYLGGGEKPEVCTWGSGYECVRGTDSRVSGSH